MKKCEKCKNYIPDGMKICPHCSLLPPRLFPNFYLYLALSVVAIVCAVRFRPFMGSPAYPQVSMGMLWTAFIIFTLFALIFLFVCFTVLRAYKNAHSEAGFQKARSIISLTRKSTLKLINTATPTENTVRSAVKRNR